jgi:hypothetical protein
MLSKIEPTSWGRKVVPTLETKMAGDLARGRTGPGATQTRRMPVERSTSVHSRLITSPIPIPVAQSNPNNFSQVSALGAGCASPAASIRPSISASSHRHGAGRW